MFATKAPKGIKKKSSTRRPGIKEAITTTDQKGEGIIIKITAATVRMVAITDNRIEIMKETIISPKTFIRRRNMSNFMHMFKKLGL